MNQANQQIKPNLYLVGFMGVGKSAIGRRLAREMGFEFVDSDDQIERKVGKKIPQIFETEGEARFRQYEREFIESGHKAGNCIVSCGGGLVVQSGMSELLKTKGIVICLFASADTIVERTSRNKNRPLLNVENPADRVRQLLAEREPIYMNSGACISTEGRSIVEVVRENKKSFKITAA
ncbi:MAG: shikimate kinase, partial [Opitutales bacterium]|nr:shikimate kinase [Opitutales bacterium]